MLLLADFIREGVRALGDLYPESEARSIILLLCERRLGTRSYTHVIEPLTAVPEDKEELLREDLRRLSAGEPVQYVTGKAEFCGLDFRVTPSVLIPRPETEILAREAVRQGLGRLSARASEAGGPGGEQAPLRILDLCTGSGCIAWTLALGVPGAEVVAVDISEDALAVAREQDFGALLEEKNAKAPLFVRGDVLASPGGFPYGPFDIVLSNPPYVRESEKASMRPNVLGHEPPSALFIPDADPLVFYRAIASWSRALMAPGAFGISEINEALGPQTLEVFSRAGFSSARLMQDLSGRDRFVLYEK